MWSPDGYLKLITIPPASHAQPQQQPAARQVTTQHQPAAATTPAGGLTITQLGRKQVVIQNPQVVVAQAQVALAQRQVAVIHSPTPQQVIMAATPLDNVALQGKQGPDGLQIKQIQATGGITPTLNKVNTASSSVSHVVAASVSSPVSAIPTAGCVAESGGASFTTSTVGALFEAQGAVPVASSPRPLTPGAVLNDIASAETSFESSPPQLYKATTPGQAPEGGGQLPGTAPLVHTSQHPAVQTQAATSAATVASVAATTTTTPSVTLASIPTPATTPSSPAAASGPQLPTFPGGTNKYAVTPQLVEQGECFIKLIFVEPTCANA